MLLCAERGRGTGRYCRYVPFGAVDEVMPYLIRRAQENSTLLAGAAAQDEQAMTWAELKRRLGLTLAPPLPDGYARAG